MIALIPARGGSKGIPNKNLADLGGRPLIAHTIEVAQRSQYVTRIVVSTDSEAIAEVARVCGAEVPFLRPPDLASDSAGGTDVVLHAANYFNALGALTDYVVLLQPTSPLRSVRDVDEAIQLAQNRSAPAVISVSEVAQHPYWVSRIEQDGTIRPFMDVPVHASRQTLPRLVYPNGAVYVVNSETLLAEKSLTPDGTLAFVMPEERSLDIDTPFDLRVANLLIAGEK